MNAHRAVCLFLAIGFSCPAAMGLEVVVDYTYDTNGFFDDFQRREALEAAAARYSRVITSSLLPAIPEIGDAWRIGFEHPGTGDDIQISVAESTVTDPILTAGGGAAYAYDFAGLEQDQWILYAGGRPLPSAGKGGTGTGLNFSSVFDDLQGHLHRGVISNDSLDTAGDLPAWGGAVTFDSNRVWHADMSTPSTGFSTDLYSIAMHEIGHVLGISTSWNQFEQHVIGSDYYGAKRGGRI